MFNGTKLLRRFFHDFELHFAWNNGQIFKAPGLVLRIVIIGLSERYEMTEGPCDDIFGTFEVVLLLLATAKYASNFFGYTWFFSQNENFHRVHYLFSTYQIA
ncbi:hypothetical protein D3C86_1730230 [compost metagenome]